MRASLSLFAALLALTGCVNHTQSTRAQLETQGRFIVIEVDRRFSYLIDPRTESCFLHQESAEFNFALVPVPCDKLKRNVPEAAPHITWVAGTGTPAP
jgi:hypothetical protein